VLVPPTLIVGVIDDNIFSKYSLLLYYNSSVILII